MSEINFWNETLHVLGQFLCPSSGAFHCTHSNGDVIQDVPSSSCSQAVSKTCMTYTIAVCRVKNSWWWTETLSETCRVSFQKLIWEISASSWFYYKKFLSYFHFCVVLLQYCLLAVVLVWEGLAVLHTVLCFATILGVEPFFCTFENTYYVQHTNFCISKSSFTDIFAWLPLFHVDRRNSVGIATGYGLDGLGIESRWGRDFSTPVQTCPGAHPASCTIGTGSLPGVKSGRGVTLTPHPLLVPLVMKE